MDVERLTWRTSSFSGGNGNGCVEVSPLWRTSSFSGSNGDGCVEVAPLPTGVAVRDTKDRTRVPHTYSPIAWTALLAGVRDGGFGA